MFEKFSNYMFNLLHYPLKVLEEKSKIYILFKVIGMQYDDLKNKALEVSKQSNINTATGLYLDKLALDRNIFRYENEEDDNLRKRLIYKADIMKKSGTKQGIILALNSLGYDVKIEPCYLTDKSKWAEFYIIVLSKLEESDNYSFDVMKKTVMEVKQASAKPNWAFKYDINTYIKNQVFYKLDIIFNINFWGNNFKKIYNNGEILFNGLFKNNGYSSAEIKEEGTIKNVDLDILTKFELANDLKFKLENKAEYFNDGTYIFDGKIINNSRKEVEVIE